MKKIKFSLKTRKYSKDLKFRIFIREEEDRLKSWKNQYIEKIENEILSYKEKIDKLNLTLQALKNE